MFSQSRQAFLAFSLFFFFGGVLEAYARCIEAGEAFGTHSEATVLTTIHGEYIHCPDELDHYGFAERRYSSQRNPLLQALIDSLGNPIVSPDPFLTRSPPRRLLSLFLYPAVPIYEAKVVYRQ